MEVLPGLVHERENRPQFQHATSRTSAARGVVLGSGRSSVLLISRGRSEAPLESTVWDPGVF